MGSYHGQAGFNTFSHLKSVVQRSTWIDPGVKYPPYRTPVVGPAQGDAADLLACEHVQFVRGIGVALCLAYIPATYGGPVDLASPYNVGGFVPARVADFPPAM
jgi:hypothetical protein